MDRSSHEFAVVGIGASAGGLDALKRFFSKVPVDSGMAYVVIVHLSEEHESVLAEILQGSCAVPVSQVTERQRVEPNHVYVIPPTENLQMLDGEIVLSPRNKTAGRQLPIDLFFRTLADAYGKDAFAVVLSGAGEDGTVGIEHIKECGGFTLVQDPCDAEYDSMPRSALGTKLVDVVLPADKLAEKTLSIRRMGHALEDKIKDESAEAAEDAETEKDALEILTLVRLRTGHDFGCYKRPTLMRRIARRLQVHELTTLGDYLKLLRTNATEVEQLQRDLLITVTNFFRDTEAFTYLQESVIPKLFANKTQLDSVRVWSCGCATGEEAYSLAMLLQEYSDTLEDAPKLQVFATDLSEEAIQSARECTYPLTIASDVSEERLKRFFIRSGPHYKITKSLRDLVLFAAHNVLRDPPFSQLDLVACRNLLIYLNRETQDRVMGIFSFGLKTGGYLFLGSSEILDTSSALFEPIEKTHRIYRSRPNPRRRSATVLPDSGHWEVKSPLGGHAGSDHGLSFPALHYRILEPYAPPSILVDENQNVIHMSERAGRYLRFAGGEPTRNLLKTIHPDLQLDLRAALLAAKQEDRRAEFRNIPLTLDEQPHNLHLIVHPISLPGPGKRYFLIVFDELRDAAQPPAEATVFTPLSGSAALDAVVRRLEDELQETKDRLRLTLEHSEISTEELKATNEELQAINEELRSATEELETSKEELQSLNEELTTLNNELKEKVDEISNMNADLQNLMHSTDIGTLFLDRNLIIKRYTRRIESLFNIIPSDIGRPFEHLTHKFDYNDLPKDAATVVNTLEMVEREVHVGPNGGHFLARILPYRTMDDRIDGVVISFVEITALREATVALREREFILSMAQEAAKAGVWTLDLDSGDAWWSDECSVLYGKKPGEVEMTLENWIADMHPEDSPAVEQALAQAVKSRQNYSFEIKLPADTEGEPRWILEVGRALFDEENKASRIAGISLDVTARTLWQQEQQHLLERRSQDEKALREADRHKNEFLATLAHELRNPLAPIRSGLEIMRIARGRQEEEAAREMISRQVDQIIRLVDDLLDISRITAGKIHLKKDRISLQEVVASALEAAKPLTVLNAHVLDVSLPKETIFLDADFTRISQTLLNLLNNAAKYTQPHGHISLSATSEREFAQIRVKDSGIGIPPNMLATIFDIFTQCGQDTQRHSGLGIGLSLVKNLVELHGGTVHAHSDGPGTGSEFTIHLPISTSQPLPTPAASAPDLSDSHSRSRILIIDDNSDAADMLQILLNNDPNDSIRVAYDGAHGLALAEEFKPEVVLLDIGLPDTDGYQVAARLRQMFPNVLLVAVSGWGQSDDRKRSSQAGFDHHLVKPVAIEEVRKLLRY
jgi:two-component system CheB/CheR fusion protein